MQVLLEAWCDHQLLPPGHAVYSGTDPGTDIQAKKEENQRLGAASKFYIKWNCGRVQTGGPEKLSSLFTCSRLCLALIQACMLWGVCVGAGPKIIWL